MTVSFVDKALIVLAVLQLAAFSLFWLDKAQARGGGRRVRESTLLTVALFGGVGALLAQRMLRHKTRKEPFRTLLGAVVVVHGAAVATGWWWLLH